MDFLVGQGAKAIVIACNTISAVAAGAIRGAYPQLPVIDIITPAAEKVAETLRGGKQAGLIATRATVNNGAYLKAVRSILPQAELPSLACPLFVPIAEEGLADSDIAVLTAKHYLEPFIDENSLDTLVLGCTHYPFLMKSILKACPGIDLIDPAGCLAGAAKAKLCELSLLAGPGEGEKAPDRFYASDLTEAFSSTVDAVTGGADYDIMQHHF